MTFSKLKIYPILMALYEQEIAALAFRTVVLGPKLAVDMHFMRIWNEPWVKAHINRVIIDEAHCVSQWGQDFHSSYLSLS